MYNLLITDDDTDLPHYNTKAPSTFNGQAKAKITNDAPSQIVSSAILNVPESVLAELAKGRLLEKNYSKS
ncbi:hypothetical protein QTP88_011861 [Uroleucon formosanum]